VCLGLSVLDQPAGSKLDVIGYFDTGHVASGRRLNAELIHMDSDYEFLVEANISLRQIKCISTFLPTFVI
jgi:hypothetical protein